MLNIIFITLFVFLSSDNYIFCNENELNNNEINHLILDPSHLFPLLKNEVILFEEFIRKHDKPYGNDLTEKAKRFKIFRENLLKIRLLNQNELGSAVYGITSVTDLTYDEFKNYLGLRPDLYQPNDNDNQQEIDDNYFFDNNNNTPDSFDWRNKLGVVSNVKNQEQCGSCWAFSATGNIEGVWALKRNESVSLSEQELVDCDKYDNGCGGGLPTNAFKTIIQLGGIESESDYPYDAQNEKCHFRKSLSHVKINSYVELPKNETYMKNYLFHNGPISIGINANAMQFYFGGISHPPSWLCNPGSLDHGVLIVGYGTGKTRILHQTQPYWIIKNSWGKTWGEKGYYRVYRGSDTCGVSQMASSAVVN
ncbi:cathepsin L-like [Dermatophagoides pteronyssinus]|uniref:Cysteine proteinase CG12163 isoform X2 n=1 Tax=Dermatophagoides pteronyssinus TaxID=6956 RepID=A0A6P6XV03_DERPT|nr:putative cysteine proteinase CG12163 isoform X2 [Dermatophagoides pteronyssinus]